MPHQLTVDHNSESLLDPKIHAGWVFSHCQKCTLCCDGSAFTVASLSLGEIEVASRRFPIVFQKVGDAVYLGLVYALQQGIPCPYLDSLESRCLIYTEERPLSCRRFPFRVLSSSLHNKRSCKKKKNSYWVVMDRRCLAVSSHGVGVPLVAEEGVSRELAEKFFLNEQHDFKCENNNFCAMLDYFGLLKKRQLLVKRDGRVVYQYTYWAVSKTKLTHLSHASLEMLRKRGYFPLIKSHVVSLGHFKLLKKMYLNAVRN
ncbi:MAG: YkgJ family cysteine cluster protein [Magnetococcus sp. DMHC-6]